MTHSHWPISKCWFCIGQSLKETMDHFAAIPVSQDPLAYLRGRMKAPYRFIVRKPSLQLRNSQFNHKTQDDEIRNVSAGNCCDSRCCQLFPRVHTLKVQQIFYLKLFEERREYGIAVGGQLHKLTESGSGITSH